MPRSAIGVNARSLRKRAQMKSSYRVVRAIVTKNRWGIDVTRRIDGTCATLVTNVNAAGALRGDITYYIEE